MSNPFFNAMESGDIAQDIREISELLQQYSIAKSVEEIDNINRKANAKIAKIRSKDGVVFAGVLPSPPNSMPLSTQEQAQNLYNILNTIKAYLEAKLISKQGGDNDA